MFSCPGFRERKDTRTDESISRWPSQKMKILLPQGGTREPEKGRPHPRSESILDQDGSHGGCQVRPDQARTRKANRSVRCIQDILGKLKQTIIDQCDMRFDKQEKVVALHLANACAVSLKEKDAQILRLKEAVNQERDKANGVVQKAKVKLPEQDNHIKTVERKW